MANTIEVGDRVRTVGLSEEDSDAGRVLDPEYADRPVPAGHVWVGWDSGVKTVCDVASLELE